MTTTATQPETSAEARPGALSTAQMESALARAPAYRTSQQAPALAHDDTVQRLWGGRLTPLMTASASSGRFAAAALTCPPTASIGTLSMADGARSKAWRNPDAIENVMCLQGRLELRYGAQLEHALELDLFDMASVPAGVRHAIANVGDGETRALVALSVAPGGTYDAVFDSAEAAASSSAAREALGVRFDSDSGTPVDAESVANRVTRFAKLVPYKKTNSTAGLSTEATEALTAGSVYTLIAPEGHIGRGPAPIYGNPGFYMSIGECSTAEDGPPPHAHQDTQESFFVLDGNWEIYTGFDRESAIAVKPGDLFATPKGVLRTFSNKSGKTARLLAIILGADLMQDAVSFSRHVGADFERRFGPEAIEAWAQKRMTFDAEERLGI